MIKIFKKEIITVLKHWAGYIAYSHLAFVVQKLISLRLISLKFASVLSVLVEQAFLLGTSWII